MKEQITLKFPLWLKIVFAVVIAGIIVYAFAQMRMEAIKEKLASLRRSYEDKLAMHNVSKQIKTDLDKKVEAAFQAAIILILVVVGVIGMIIYNTVSWNLEQWANFLGVVQPLLLVAVGVLMILLQRNISAIGLFALLKKRIEISVYKHYGFDCTLMPRLEGEIACTKAEISNLNKELEGLRKIISFG
jgi:H+/gluconate symporter-like permease